MCKWVVCALVIAISIPLITYSQDTQTQTEQNQNVDLDVSPNHCVTLRQGQPCYVRVRFSWSANEALAVCLYNLEGAKIACWNASETGSIVLGQTLPNTTEYILVDTKGVELNRTSVSVSWVYRKKRSKRRWRLF